MTTSILSLAPSPFVDKTDRFSESSSTNTPMTPPAVEEEHSLVDTNTNVRQQQPFSSCVDDESNEYYAAEHVMSWLLLDDPLIDTLNDNIGLPTPLPKLPVKAQRLPKPPLSSSWHDQSSKFSCWASAESIWSTSSPTPADNSTQYYHYYPEHTGHQWPKQRRSSFPVTSTDYWTNLVSGDLDRPFHPKNTVIPATANTPAVTSGTGAMDSRRHSSPCTSTSSARQQLSPGLMQRIDDYFSGTYSTNNHFSATPMSDMYHMGKGIPLHQLQPNVSTLYSIELSPGKYEMFYMNDYDHGYENDKMKNGGDGGRADGVGSTVPQKGDLVIVEADRGQDLGKVVDTYSDFSDAKVPETTCIRRLYRLATPVEIATLPAKVHDEAKALLVCRSKIKERELPMEVICAEYQWDRRKLTFFFTAEERVDFRELVRELFKLYKTRIWMCAAAAAAATTTIITK